MCEQGRCAGASNSSRNDQESSAFMQYCHKCVAPFLKCSRFVTTPPETGDSHCTDIPRSSRINAPKSMFHCGIALCVFCRRAMGGCPAGQIIHNSALVLLVQIRSLPISTTLGGRSWRISRLTIGSHQLLNTITEHSAMIPNSIPASLSMTDPSILDALVLRFRIP